MPTEILATAATADDSADVVVADGDSLTVALKGMTDDTARVLVLLKDDAGAYNGVTELTAYDKAKVLAAPGTYRFTRVAGGTCGVFSG
ncbi:hypothetical protein [Aquibium sp. ELW1220]|uniref:hypothetical protein n=1 Tax=Aquibium sp. ELW1220 TaxID=2976766 RepID=UPI0025AFD58A|nr:hypothetical protein [Aquibium sp. ELW1220]MDN2581648.1 hypothetical protein [Aquibium sp. ELW1220]